MAGETIMNGSSQERGGPWVETFRTPLIIGLGALLALQLVAAILLSIGARGSLAPTDLDQPLLAFDPGRVTSIRIDGPDGNGVDLRKSGDGWVLSGLGDFPADAPKVDRLIEQLAALKRPLPVATSTQALTRHKVADDAFERRVTLSAGDEPLATLLLGDSPGFRRLFARPADESVVYDIDLALYDASDRGDDWISRDLLHVPEETITAISGGDWALTKSDNGWTLEGSDQAPDQATVDDVLSRLSGLGYRGVLGTEAKPEYRQDKPTIELTLRLADGNARSYRISKADEGQDLVLKASDHPWYFKLSDYDIDGLADLDRAKLLGEAKEKEEDQPPAATLGGKAPNADEQPAEAEIGAPVEDTAAQKEEAAAAGATQPATGNDAGAIPPAVAPAR